MIIQSNAFKQSDLNIAKHIFKKYIPWNYNEGRMQFKAEGAYFTSQI